MGKTFKDSRKFYGSALDRAVRHDMKKGKNKNSFARDMSEKEQRWNRLDATQRRIYQEEPNYMAQDFAGYNPNY